MHFQVVDTKCHMTFDKVVNNPDNEKIKVLAALGCHNHKEHCSHFHS